MRQVYVRSDQVGKPDRPYTRTSAEVGDHKEIHVPPTASLTIVMGGEVGSMPVHAAMLQVMLIVPLHNARSWIEGFVTSGMQDR